ncbi:hypothetical protein [uncultured Bradyrhizobium sp.]|jgi:hypothetical protein|uniref:hypothetical protein n=1 Tax=uncultured Bradyrhizobium sp. TaxID=199684 RepID=UPI002618F553|nr:hypothetical protein [uncultured Bradyrhizobium sp.]
MTDPKIEFDLQASIRENGALLHAINRIRHEFLRRHLIPHEVLVKDADVPPDVYAVRLRDYLEERGLHSSASFLAHLAPLIGKCPPKFILRIIFPEIEEMFRQKVYEASARTVVKFREARFIVLNHITKSTPAHIIEILSKTDAFLLIQLVFLDLAYTDVKEIKATSSREERRAYLRLQRSLEYIGNRHEILHGLRPAGRSKPISDSMITNVLTLYVSAARICEYLSEIIIARNSPRLQGSYDAGRREFIALNTKVAEIFRLFSRVLPRTID